MPTYYPPERVTYMRRAYWACVGNIHKHKSRAAADRCESKYPGKVPVGRGRRDVMRPGGVA